MDKLLTKKDLAERWQVSEKTIDLYRSNGVIVPVKGLPCIRFNPEYIKKIEGRIPERTTLRERKLEIELKEIVKERDSLILIIRNVFNESSKAIIKINSI